MSTASRGTTGVPRPRRNPKQARSIERMNRVMEAAKALVLELGPEPVTTTDIADRAGVSVAWIYQYFADREAIFDTLVLEVVERQVALAQETALRSIGDDAKVIVRKLLQLTVRLYRDEPAFVRLFCSPFRSQEMLRANELHDAAQSRWLHDLLTGNGVLRRASGTLKAIELATAIADRGLEFAFTEGRNGDPAVVRGVEAAILAVLGPFVLDRG